MQKIKEFKTYSEAFKLAVLEKIERGKYKSLGEARRRNGIRGSDTLSRWLKQYGRDHLLPKKVRISTMQELNELQAARKLIKKLKTGLAKSQEALADSQKALAKAKAEWLLENSFLEIACEKLRTTPEDLKKKSSFLLSDELKKKAAR